MTSSPERREGDQAQQNAVDKWPKIHEIVRSLRRLRQENHFAELIEEAWTKKWI